MSKEALDLALEALGLYQAAGFGNSTDFNKQHEAFYKAQTAIIAIKQARALDKMADNARELGLDYEPVLKDNSNYRLDPPVAEPVAWVFRKSLIQKFRWNRDKPTGEALLYWEPLYTTPPARPSVPDALTSADIQENIEYVAGWNDCRQAMLEMMK